MGRSRTPSPSSYQQGFVGTGKQMPKLAISPVEDARIYAVDNSAEQRYVQPANPFKSLEQRYDSVQVLTFRGHDVVEDGEVSTPRGHAPTPTDLACIQKDQQLPLRNHASFSQMGWADAQDSPKLGFANPSFRMRGRSSGVDIATPHVFSRTPSPSPDPCGRAQWPEASNIELVVDNDQREAMHRCSAPHQQELKLTLASMLPDVPLPDTANTNVAVNAQVPRPPPPGNWSCAYPTYGARAVVQPARGGRATKQKNAQQSRVAATREQHCCVVSVGSVGHPLACKDACKYNSKKRGCKDGPNCDHCHLCQWKRCYSDEKA